MAVTNFPREANEGLVNKTINKIINSQFHPFFFNNFGNFMVNPHSYYISVEDSQAMEKLTINLSFPPSLSKDLIPNTAQGKTDDGHIR